MRGRVRQLMHCARRMVLLVAAMAVLLAVVRGGTRFFYCPMAHLAFDANPCASDEDRSSESDRESPAVRVSDCCEERWRPAAPAANAPNDSSARIAPAGVAHVLPPSHDVSGALWASARMPFQVARAVRAGPPPPAASERRAQLMVFHL